MDGASCITRVTFGKSRVREIRTPGSVRAKAKWLSYSTMVLLPRAGWRCRKVADILRAAGVLDVGERLTAIVDRQAKVETALSNYVRARVI